MNLMKGALNVFNPFELMNDAKDDSKKKKKKLKESSEDITAFK